MAIDLYNADCMNELENIADNSVDSIVTDPPASISFMGKKWDSDKGGREEWVQWLSNILEECKRIIKPGGHILVWALPKRSHWTALAIEDAGFEIRDIVNHMFGTGFPKNHDISKAIEKLQENEQEYEGYGTALKPSCEHWILARKPISKSTIAKNVLKWGTGGLNIDGCRIGHNPGYKYNADKNGTTFHGEQGKRIKQSATKKGQQYIESTRGRWPSNVTLDEEVAKMLDEQVGECGNKWKKNYGEDEYKGKQYKGDIFAGGGYLGNSTYCDKGGPSRFFYVTKASRKERELGLNNFDKKKRAPHRKDENPGGDNPRNRGIKKVKNIHPTVKSINLMKWLCRLITPKNGIVLDPFMGSGSTGVACMLEGFSFIGIEKEKEYFDIAKARINYAKNNPQDFDFLNKKKNKKTNKPKQENSLL